MAHENLDGPEICACLEHMAGKAVSLGVFTSVSDLARKLRRYINAYSANAKPIRWKYVNTNHRIR